MPEAKKDKDQPDETGNDVTPKDVVTEDSATAEKGGVKSSGPIVDDGPVKGDDGMVEIVLAHPITTDRDKDYLGIPRDHKCNVGDKVKVPRNGASSLINAGYAQVDPEDHKAVRAALGLPDLDVQPASTSGNK